MPDKTVTKIEALPKLILGGQMEQKELRVAAYARVSTDHEDQLNSIAAQKDYYTKQIEQHPGWRFVGVYADEGISGLGTKLRVGFNQMMEDCVSGKIDMIQTKSISRFARNTVDSITAIRKLKEKGIGVFFEKENIFTLDAKGEFLLTLMSSLAQEESRSISENVSWGQRKRFADGKSSLAYSRFLGYDQGKEKFEMVVNPEQARTVKEIYREFLLGFIPHQIALNLTERGFLTATGEEKWSQAAIRGVLTNEKYKGAALLQKYFTADFLTKRCRKNEGQLP